MAKAIEAPGFTLISRIPEIIADGIPDALNETLAEGAEKIAEGAKNRVPVESGALRDAIHVEEGDEEFVWFVVAGDNDAFYGHFIEFGTSETAARPFLIPAAEGELDAITDAAIEELGDV